MKRKIAAILSFALAYLIIYFISTSQFAHLYTPEWTARSVLPLAAIITIAPLFWGKFRFTAITLSGYILGVLIGELWGEAAVPLFNPHHPHPEALHSGWVLWGIVFILSIAIGIVVEIIRKRRKNVCACLYISALIMSCPW